VTFSFDGGKNLSTNKTLLLMITCKRACPSFASRHLELEAQQTLKSNLNNVKHPKIPCATGFYVSRCVDDNVSSSQQFNNQIPTVLYRAAGGPEK